MEPGSNSNEIYSTLPESSDREPLYLLQISFIPRTHYIWLEGYLSVKDTLSLF